MSAKVVVVLGAAGFIGRRVCLSVSQAGRTVLGLGHGRWTQDEWQRSGLSDWLDAEISVDSIDRLVGDNEIDALIHCAGSGAVSYSYAHPFEDYKRAVFSVAAALDFVHGRASKNCRVVIASSAAVYGDQGDVDLIETSMCSPMSPYGFNKLAAERLCDSYSRFFEVRSSVVRLFSVYGEGLKKQLLWDAMNKFGRGERAFLGTGNEMRDWLHVDDAADLLCRAALQPQASFEIYNGSNEKATTRTVLSQLAEHAHVAEPVFTGESHAGNPRRLTANSSHARRQLGWNPGIALQDGLRRYSAWYLNAN